MALKATVALGQMGLFLLLLLLGQDVGAQSLRPKTRAKQSVEEAPGPGALTNGPGMELGG